MAQVDEACLMLTMYQPSNIGFRALSWYLKPVETNLTSSNPGQDIALVQMFQAKQREIIEKLLLDDILVVVEVVLA